MKSKLDHRIKASLSGSAIYPDENHLSKVITLAHLECTKKGKGRRMNSAGFLLSQIKYTAWKIWLVQGLILIVLCMALSACFGTSFINISQHVAVLLCGSAILVLMTAIPFIQRGLRYQMHEIEAAAMFSSAKLLAAKLLIIGIGDSVMLGCVLLLVLFKTTTNIGTAFLYLMLPFLTVTSAFLYLLGHVPAHRFSGYCGCIGAVVFMIVSGLSYLNPAITKMTFSVSWGFVYFILAIFCIYQLHYIMRRSSYTEVQFS